MVTLGDNGYYISVSTALDGADSKTVGPAGDIVYLYAESWVNPRANKDKVKQMANNNSYGNRMGKMARELNLTKCIMLDDDGEATNNTDSYGLKITLLDKWCDLGQAAIYVIVASQIDSVNVPLSRSGSNPVYAFKCSPTRFRPRPDGGVYLVDITFKERSLY